MRYLTKSRFKSAIECPVKLFYIEINEKGYQLPLQKTNELLQKDNVVIFEAAFRYENLFIRADIIVKEGNQIKLIEVKSKSLAGGENTRMVGAKGGLTAAWRPYLYDVAFQKYVIGKAFPEHSVKAHLMLADKEKKASVDGFRNCYKILCRSL